MSVIVGFDHHPASMVALQRAGDLAAALGTHVHVVHVTSVSDGTLATHGGGEPTTAVTSDQVRVAGALDGLDVQWTFHRRDDGDPAHALLEAASQYDASIIVVGRPEDGLGAALGHMVTGAVARTLIRRSPLPVLVVPNSERREWGPW